MELSSCHEPLLFGQVSDYSSGRDTEDLVSFMRTSSQGIEEEEPSDSMAPSNKHEPQTSNFVPSRSVKSLVQTNFSQYLNDKQAAMVMFYNPSCPKCHNAKPHFMKAAKTTANHKDYGYATVDCTTESGLCDKESVDKFPTFKLYVSGRYLNQYSDPPNADAMRAFVENAPITDQSHGKKHRDYREDL